MIEHVLSYHYLQTEIVLHISVITCNFEAI